MPKPRDTLTFTVQGRIEIADLDVAIQKFHRLVKALTPKKAGVSWLVEELSASSAIATLRGEANDISVVEEVVDSYEEIGESLQRGVPLSSRFSKTVLKAAEDLAGMAVGRGVRLSTPDREFLLSANGADPKEEGKVVSLGVVTGRIEMLSSRSGLRCNLYDSVFDKAVECFLNEGQEERMREAWGRRAIVSGRVSRGPSGRPLSIHAISGIEVLPEIEPGTFRQARGVLPWKPGQETGDLTVRRLRDG